MKVAGVEAQQFLTSDGVAELVLFRPVDPTDELFGAEAVALDRAAAGFGVDGVQVEAVPARDERERLGGVGAQFVGGAGLAGVVARDCESAADFLAGVLE